MKKLKRLLGYFIMAMIFPVMLSLMSLDGKICYHGVCDTVTPFWGGIQMGIIIDMSIIAILLTSLLIIYLIA